MCGICGCADGGGVRLVDPATGAETELVRAHAHGHGHGHSHHDHGHDHGHGHGHDHADHSHGPGETVVLERRILADNDREAARNRGWFEGRRIVALNLMSSPGSGKTTLIVRTLRDLGGGAGVFVVEGDQMTTHDADRVRKAGATAIQVNTGAGCHLEADMVAQAVRALDPPAGSLLFVENVGNLVCPAMFDLGERAKVVVISTTEGEDKPLKYPHMFRAADVVVLNKLDLAPHVGFDDAELRANVTTINPRARLIALSARTGDGMGEWIGFLRSELAKA
ncbi:MAG: hydrogenase nickel incorporation protein HypB [Hyphomicrobiales bacterium]|nr:hydrogenase nickel incorporation protein HypB [Hyphomicrobiales bacterium]